MNQNSSIFLAGFLSNLVPRAQDVKRSVACQRFAIFSFMCPTVLKEVYFAMHENKTSALEGYPLRMHKKEQQKQHMSHPKFCRRTGREAIEPTKIGLVSVIFNGHILPSTTPERFEKACDGKVLLIS